MAVALLQEQNMLHSSTYILILLFITCVMTPKTPCNACEKSVKNRNSIKCKLCPTKVHFKYNYLNYADSQCIKFLNKT